MPVPTSLTYLFDPLCGWCYGAGPALDRLAALPGVTLRLMPTGLFAGPGARLMDAAFAAHAWENDQRIAALTGLPFTAAYRRNVLEGPPRPFDSGPATLALTAVWQEAPAREREALKAIQSARYADGCDITDRAVLADVLDALGLSAAARRAGAPDADLGDAAASRIAAARGLMGRFGLRGVPAVLVGEGERQRPLSGNLLFGDPDAASAAIADG